MERQFRMACTGCDLAVSYRSEESLEAATLVYLMPGAVASMSGDADPQVRGRGGGERGGREGVVLLKRCLLFLLLRPQPLPLLLLSCSAWSGVPPAPAARRQVL